ncbi:MAG: oligosaccharide flippase family protein [Gammaproteobacteria bacterium]|nr:oligosaccharide flippase family protein [Gammaproteobacteria bacterium]
MISYLTSLFPQAIRHTFIYGASIILMKSVSLLMLPITAFYLRPEQFGQLELLTSIAMICSILVGLGLENTLFRYAGTNVDFDKKKQIAANILILSLLTGTLALAIGWYLAPSFIEFTAADISVFQLRIILVVISFEGAIAIPLAWFRMQEKVLLFFLATTLRTVAQAALIMLFLSMQYQVTGVLVACFIAAGLQAVILSLIMLKEVGFSFKLNKCSEYLNYSLPIVGSGFIAFSLGGFDRWLLAAKFALATVLLVQPFGMWWLPKRFAILKQHQGTLKPSHYITIGITVVMSIAVVVSFVAPFLIHLLLPSEYHQTMTYVLWLVLAMAYKEISELVNIGCFFGNSTTGQFYINLTCAAISLSIMWFGIVQLGIWAVVIALNVAYAGKALLFYLVSQRKLPLPYSIPKLTMVISLGVTLIILSQFIPSSWGGWGISVLVLVLVLAVAVAVALTVKRDLLSLNKAFG